MLKLIPACFGGWARSMQGTHAFRWRWPCGGGREMAYDPSRRAVRRSDLDDGDNWGIYLLAVVAIGIVGALVLTGNS